MPDQVRHDSAEDINDAFFKMEQRSKLPANINIIKNASSAARLNVDYF
ncbi:MAG: hypothetical protein P1U40_05035 [Coxiellaceae bacterium]|nr:hypothetical protein [Coxiellaceae bacterium]